MWLQIWNFFSGQFQSEKPSLTLLQDQKVQSLLKDKADLDSVTIYLAESKAPYGMMAGFPGHPVMVLSKNLYETFSFDQLEFVVFHEAGHYIYWHSVQEFVFGLILAILGIFIIKKLQGKVNVYFLAIFLGSIFGVFALNFGKLKESEADAFAIQKMTNPNGAVEAAYKFKEAYDQPEKDNFWESIMFRRIPFYERIKNAEEEINNRNVN